MTKYTYIALTKDNIKYLYALYEATYQKTCTAGFFEKKYDSYSTHESMGTFAFYNNQPVGFFGLVPMLFSIGKKNILGCQASDLMVDQSHRKKGLCAELGKLSLEQAKNNNIHFCFAFPNQNSYPMFVKKLGFTFLENMNRYEIRFSKSVLGVLARKLKILRLIEVQTELKNPLIEEGFDGVIYNEDFLKYKKATKNKLVGNNNFTFWVNQKNAIWLGAISISKNESLDALISNMNIVLKSCPTTYMTSQNTRIDKFLKQKYVAQDGFPIVVRNLTNIYSLENLKFQFADVDIF